MESYGKVIHIGKREVSDILREPVYVEEKIDGSQFSFGKSPDGVVWCASRGGLLDWNTTDKLFRKAVETARALAPKFEPGLTVRAEAVCAPRHNKLTYERAPAAGLVVFDAQLDGGYFDRVSVEALADELGLEVVPLIAPTGLYTSSDLEKLVEGPSMLGGPREGIVIKRVGGGADRAKAKWVGKAFLEKTGQKPPKTSSVHDYITQYGTEAHWDKCIQHLREAGDLEFSMRDVGALMREHARDLTEESEAEIRDALWPKIWKDIVKGCSAGLPAHYRKYLDARDADG